MVAPLLALIGYGAQAYGSDQQKQAQAVADYTASINNRFNSAGREAEQAQSNAAYDNLGGQWNDSNALAVDEQGAPQQRMAFDNAGAALGGQIAQAAGQPGAIDPQVMASADNTAFTRAMASKNKGNQIRTNALNKVLENNAGLDAKNTLINNSNLDNQDRKGQIAQRIHQIQMLQNYANGVRDAALQKTGAQHALDGASAASTGSGAMYLGALLQAGAVLSNRPQYGQTATGPLNGVDSPSNLGNTNPQV
jgi:hypothetical protein